MSPSQKLRLPRRAGGPLWTFALLLVAGTPVCASAQSAAAIVKLPPAEFTIPRVDRPPQLEDFLKGPLPDAWTTDFRQRDPGDGDPVSQRTAAYVAHDDGSLYVVFVCHDDPAKVRARIARREEIDGDDAVVVYLDTFRDRERAYMFMANPLGVQLDGIVTEGQDDDLSFDAVWHSEGRLTADGYVVRIVIPFRSLRFPRAPTQKWGVALGRIIRRNSEEAYWPHITKRVQGFVPQFHVVQGLPDISPGRNMQVTPYSMFARARFLDEDAVDIRSAHDQRLGVDAKVVLRDALTVDATINPDFSQVETDDPQVTVNERFEVFFPEKRPFFIENSGYFQTPVNLFFSRRIVDPGAGLRLSGKAGRWAVGAIAINDREPGRVPAPDPLAGSHAGVGALRVQREIGEESTIGLLVTDRELDRSFARMLSLDSRLKVGKNWAFSGQLMRSETRELNDTSVAGFGAFAELRREGRHLDYKGRYVQFNPEFSAPLGFVERVGIRQMEQEVQHKWRPKGRVVLAYGPTASVSYVWDPQGRQLDRELAAEFLVELVGETKVKLKRVEAFELFDDVPFRPYETKASVRTEWLTWLAFDGSYKWGGAVNHDPASGLTPFLGRAAEAELGVTLRATPRLRVGQTFIHNRLNTRAGSRVFTERLWRSKINYQFSRFLSLRAIVDYKAEFGDTTLVDIEDKKRWSADLLLTYLVNPGTAVQVGYTDQYENLALITGSVERTRRPELSTARQLFLKVSYLLRF